jgi:hypothetical protein
LIEYLGGDPANLPLSDHRQDSFYTMRTDAFDRFGTRLEQRFSRAQIETMMHEAGLDEIRFSESPPFWCAVGRRSRVELSRPGSMIGGHDADVGPRRARGRVAAGKMGVRSSTERQSTPCRGSELSGH